MQRRQRAGVFVTTYSTKPCENAEDLQCLLSSNANLVGKSTSTSNGQVETQAFQLTETMMPTNFMIAPTIQSKAGALDKNPSLDVLSAHLSI